MVINGVTLEETIFFFVIGWLAGHQFVDLCWWVWAWWSSQMALDAKAKVDEHQ